MEIPLFTLGKRKKLNIAYLHGRFGSHLMQSRLAKSLDAKFEMIDKYKKWKEGSRSKLILIYTWIYNAFAFKNAKKIHPLFSFWTTLQTIYNQILQTKSEVKADSSPWRRIHVFPSHQMVCNNYAKSAIRVS